MDIEMLGIINGLSIGVLVALTTGLVEVFKQFSQDSIGIDDNKLPLVALVIGVVLSALWSTQTGAGLVVHLFLGIGIGLASSGLYDTTQLTE